MTQAEIVVRKPSLDFDRPIERYYIGGNVIRTHVFNALNLTFPEGERFFVKAVNDHKREIRDAALLDDVRAFSAQEGQHAHQHERFFAAMRRQGYKIDRFLAHFHDLGNYARDLPRAVRLAITAGAEHYTATIAMLLLDENLLANSDPTMRELITWHAIEEMEHKHVAYDTLLAAYPRSSYPLRVYGFLIATLVIFGYVTYAFRFLMRQDARAKRVTRVQIEDSRRELRQATERRFRQRLRRALLRYLRPGFHPNQCDDRALLDRNLAQWAWRSESRA